MSERIKISITKRVLPDGVENVITAEDGRAWTKFYSSEAHAGADLNDMGLVDRLEETNSENKTVLYSRRYAVKNAIIDVALLDQFRFSKG
jgi:hypothetical protein